MLQASFLLIVTGPSASGKTTLGRRLASDLKLPFFWKDGFKEPLYDHLGNGDRAWSKRLGFAAYELLYRTIEIELAAARSLAVEANFDPRYATPYFRRALERWPVVACQVLCTCDGAVLLQRFLDRAARGERHPGHGDLAYIDEFRPGLLRGRLDPLGIDGPMIEVDTTDWSSVDYPRVLQEVQAAMEERGR